MARIEVLDEDEGHADAGGHGVDEPAAGIEPTRRSAYSDDREIRQVQGNAAGLADYCSASMVFSRRRQWTASSMFMPHRVVSDRVAVGAPGNRPPSRCLVRLSATQVADTERSLHPML
jgi:hypothetical protein